MISKNQIKYIQSLHSKKNREQEELFIIEGIKLVTEFILDGSYAIKELFATKDYIDQHFDLLKSKSVSYSEISSEDLKKISLQTTPNQILATVEAKHHELNSEWLQQSLTLYLDDIRDPGNLGTMIRIADWFGIKQVICSENTTEVYNPKTLQASMGAVLRVNTIYMNFENLLLQAKNIPVYGAVLEGENIYTSRLQKGIIVIGNEANGISQLVLKQITHAITIPAATNNGSESLNAANACAIICGEFYRQLNY
jgi:TrmH family RNA methyltransferase